MDIPTVSTVVLLGIAVVTALYKVFQIEKKIYDNVNVLCTRLSESISADAHKLENHLVRHEQIDYLLHAQDQKIDHKFERLARGQREIKGFLAKNTNFIDRDLPL